MCVSNHQNKARGSVLVCFGMFVCSGNLMGRIGRVLVCSDVMYEIAGIV